MPNRYLPSALTEIVEEQHESMIDKSDDTDEYPAEWEAVVEMLQPEYQDEFWNRRAE